MFTKISILWLSSFSSNVAVQVQTASSYKSFNMPSFYRGEKGVFTCKIKTNDEVSFNKLVGFGIKHRSLNESVDVFHPQCTVSYSANGSATAVANLDFKVSDEDCATAYQKLTESEVATLKIDWEMRETGSYSCSIYCQCNKTIDEPVAIVQQLLVAPLFAQHVILGGGAVYAGEEARLHCDSTGGDPPANWKYAIGGEVIGPEPGRTSVVAPEDNGKSVSCFDLSHPNYNGGRSFYTYREYQLEVYFMESRQIAIEAALFTNTTLECDVNRNLPHGTSLSYSWARNGSSLADQTKDLKIFFDEDVTYECLVNASDARLQGPAKVTFKITPPTSSTTAEFRSSITPSTSSATAEFRSSITPSTSSATAEFRSSIAVKSRSLAASSEPTEIIWMIVAVGIWMKIYVQLQQRGLWNVSLQPN